MCIPRGSSITSELMIIATAISINFTEKSFPAIISLYIALSARYTLYTRARVKVRHEVASVFLKYKSCGFTASPRHKQRVHVRLIPTWPYIRAPRKQVRRKAGLAPVIFIRIRIYIPNTYTYIRKRQKGKITSLICHARSLSRIPNIQE